MYLFVYSFIWLVLMPFSRIRLRRRNGYLPVKNMCPPPTFGCSFPTRNLIIIIIMKKVLPTNTAFFSSHIDWENWLPSVFLFASIDVSYTLQTTCRRKKAVDLFTLQTSLVDTFAGWLLTVWNRIRAIWQRVYRTHMYMICKRCRKYKRRLSNKN